MFERPRTGERAVLVRDLAQEMKTRGLPMDLEQDGLADTLARTLWGWIAVLTMTLAMCALFLARWWQSLPERAGSFGAEFRGVRLGRVLGIAGALFIGASLFTEQALVGDIGRLFLGALVKIGYDGPVLCEPMSRTLRGMPRDEALATVAAAMKKAFALVE